MVPLKVIYVSPHPKYAMCTQFKMSRYHLLKSALIVKVKEITNLFQFL